MPQGVRGPALDGAAVGNSGAGGQTSAGHRLPTTERELEQRTVVSTTIRSGVV